jgi:hypothetical protein
LLTSQGGITGTTILSSGREEVRMAILILETVMLVAGIVALIRGEIPLTKVHYVDGWAARIAAVLLCLPLPLALGVGLVIGIMRAAHGQTVEPKEAATLSMYIDVPIISICGFLATGIALGSLAGDAWRGPTYLSDTEGSLGSWNAPVVAEPKGEGRRRPGPKRKKKKSQLAKPAAHSGIAIMLGVAGAFLLLGVLVSGGTIWWVHRQSAAPEPAVKNSRSKSGRGTEANAPAPGPAPTASSNNASPVEPKPNPSAAKGAKPEQKDKSNAEPPPVDGEKPVKVKGKEEGKEKGSPKYLVANWVARVITPTVIVGISLSARETAAASLQTLCDAENEAIRVSPAQPWPRRHLRLHRLTWPRNSCGWQHQLASGPRT